MHALSAMALMDIWERGRAQGPLPRAALLLAAAYPSTPPGQLAQMPIGQRDALLLALREATFGSRIASVAPCPQCGEQLELAFSHADLPQQRSADDEPHQLEVDGYALRFRCVNSDDLAALCAGIAGQSAPRLELLGRCVLEAWQADTQVRVDRLPAHVLDAVEARMAQADAGADLRIAVECPACGHRWQALFDIVSFFWDEIESWACRLLREVHALASAYGWSESEILGLSPFRRRCYLEMVGA
ncbi:T4 family baseplate hub assembly chaperone [Pseudoduganella sp. HUAS MS19]